MSFPSGAERLLYKSGQRVPVAVTSCQTSRAPNLQETLDRAIGSTKILTSSARSAIKSARSVGASVVTRLSALAYILYEFDAADDPYRLSREWQVIPFPAPRHFSAQAAQEV